MAATYLGTWIVLLVLFIYGPILIAQMSDPKHAAKVEGINYFAGHAAICRSDSRARQRDGHAPVKMRPADLLRF